MPFRLSKSWFSVYSALLIAALILMICLAPNPIAADGSYLVTTTSDLDHSGVCGSPCSLRDAINAANASASNDTITFNVNGTFTIGSSDLPNITNNGTLTITGNGAANTIIDGNNAHRVLTIASGTVSISGVTIQNGNIGTSTGDTGGGIYNGGSLTITSSIIKNNIAGGGGGIFTTGGLTVVNSLFTGNQTQSAISGGAVYVDGGTTTLLNSTLSGNTGTSGGGADLIIAAGTANLKNSILANSLLGADTYRNGGTINAQNTLIESGLSDINGATNSNNLTGDPALDSNFKLTSTSSAIDAGSDSLISGYSSDLAGNTRIQGAHVDMGAYESSFTTANTVTISPATLSVAEGSSNTFTLTRTGSTTADLTVNLTLTAGTGTDTSDYTLSGGSISGQSGAVTATIPAGGASVNVTFAALVDNQAEAANTLTVDLATSANYTLGATTESVITIPANEFVVTNTNDSGDGSLRQAITNANNFPGDDTITFASAINGQTITVASTLPNNLPHGALTIQGNGASSTMISGSDAISIFLLNGGNTVNISGVTIMHGNAMSDVGGGIIVSGTTLTLTDSTITHNNASSGGGIFVAGSGTVNVIRSTISNNTSGNGSGIEGDATASITLLDSIITNNVATGSGGGIYASKTLTITNTVVSGNSATFGGGMVIPTSSIVTVNDSTISGNSATFGGGIRVNGKLDLNNSIVANSLSGGDFDNSSGTIDAQNSLIEDGLSAINGTSSNNLTGTPDLNADLTLKDISRAINAGDDSLIPNGVTTDLAGAARIQSTHVDMGAYESAFNTPIPTVTISPATLSVAEGSSNTFTLTRTGSTGADLTVNLSITHGTGTDASDYTLSGGAISGQSGTVTATIPAGSASVNVNFAALVDNQAEAANTLTVDLATSANYTLGATT
ncbi:MAG TPA: choice-of-anchor Q domain-containing protein, partial [Phototrophicaceae bacterium]|nr:choice-of-anchor Q domain-containing protein [Phototrophicaceae bacterium]